MQLILEEKKGRKINDVTDYILNADKKTFNKIIKTLKNPMGELDIRYTPEIEKQGGTVELLTIGGLITNFKGLDKEQYSQEQRTRIEMLSKCRGIKDISKFIKTKYKLDKNEIEQIVQVLTGKKTFSEFIEEKSDPTPPKKGFLDFFKRKMPKTLPEGKSSIFDRYGSFMKSIINGELSFNFSLEQDDIQNFERVVTAISGEEVAKRHKVVLGKNQEDDWQINPELRSYVYQDMPPSLTPEEQATWVYMKLCKTFSYDDKQIFDTKDNSFNKAFLEGIKPGDKLVCFDFSRVYAKFINDDLSDNMEAKVIGGRGHFLVELVGQDCVVTAESTSVRSHTNEFFKMRMGLPIEGISEVHDPFCKFSQAISTVTPLVYQDVQSINSYMSMLDTIRAEESVRDEPKENDSLRKTFCIS